MGDQHWTCVHCGTEGVVSDPPALEQGHVHVFCPNPECRMCVFFADTYVADLGNDEVAWMRRRPQALGEGRGPRNLPEPSRG